MMNRSGVLVLVALLPMASCSMSSIEEFGNSTAGVFKDAASGTRNLFTGSGDETNASPQTSTGEAQAMALNHKGRVEKIGNSGQFKVFPEGFDELAQDTDRFAQQKTYWCWAAGSMMVHHYNGHTEVTQEEIVERIQATTDTSGNTFDPNDPLNMAGNPDQIYLALVMEHALAYLPVDLDPETKAMLEGYRTEPLTKSGKPKVKARPNIMGQLSSRYLPRDTSSDVVVRELTAGRPVLVGYQKDDPERPGKTFGHIAVIYEATYENLTSEQVRSLRRSVTDAVSDEIGGIAGDSKDATKKTGRQLEEAYTHDTKILQVTFFDPQQPQADESASGFEHINVTDWDSFYERIDFVVTDAVAQEVLRNQNTYMTLAIE